MNQSFERYEKIAQAVFEEYSKIYYASLRIQAIRHTTLVDGWITLLAGQRNLDLELAKISAILHDIAKYSENCTRNHARIGSQLAQNRMLEMNEFAPEEIEQVRVAILHHSDKDHIDDPLDEALKDADILASWSVDPNEPLGAVRENRFIRLKKELNLR